MSSINLKIEVSLWRWYHWNSKECSKDSRLVVTRWRWDTIIPNEKKIIELIAWWSVLIIKIGEWYKRDRLGIGEYLARWL